MKILLTGASGYIGSQLVSSWLEDKNVEKIIALDVSQPRFLWKADHPKVHFIQKNLADTDLEKELEVFLPVDVVVHAAYFIRTPYFKKDREYQEHSNFQGAENVFDFALKSEVKKLIHFSTVAVYGAHAKNELNNPFTEESEAQETIIAYGRDKKIIEKKLSEIFEKHHPKTEVICLRVGSVSGPFLQNVVKKTGLLSFMKGLLPFLPITSEKSARQYVHEDDVVSAVNFWLTHQTEPKIIPLNLASKGFFTFREIAKILRKKTLKIPHQFAQIFFFLTWHLSLGKIPTPPGVINSYSYPIIVDGTKITKFGFAYKYNSTDALLATKGKFAS
ncbi:MAG: hypothetical protein G01um101420_288 [Parcubacteria group bacterium Gr01-1014_20]|nr:MAG: hypothetical protein G01um101420_288 [Parcubacteria group bacterium Gr01-1014_20]